MATTWQILPDPLSADVYTSGPYADSLQSSVGQPTGLFGHGLLRPFRRGKNDDFQTGDGVALIRAAVGLVLGTVCDSSASDGELPWRTEFGSILQNLRQQNLDAAIEALARHYVVEALSRWIPAIKVTKMQLAERDNTLFIHVTYEVVDPVGRQVIVTGLTTSLAVS